MVRQFLCTTEKSKEGVVYMYDDTSGTFMGLEFKEVKDAETIGKVLANIPITLTDFLKWAAAFKGMTTVEITQSITFETMWRQYDDASRSSKKKSRAIWDKMKKDDQVKAYHYYPKYERNRGSADKKYLETYLRAELWNN